MPVTLTRDLQITSDALNQLRAQAWADAGSPDWTPVLARSLGWVCAVDVDVDGGALVGFVNIAWDGGAHAFLLDTTVHRRYQRRGIGRDLVREAAALAGERGADWLHVDYETELDGFYRGCGFRPTPAGLLDLTALQAEDRSAPQGPS